MHSIVKYIKAENLLTLFVLIPIICGFAFSFSIRRVDLAVRGLSIAIPSLFSLLLFKKIVNNSSYFEVLPIKPLYDPRKLTIIFLNFYLLSFIVLIGDFYKPIYDICITLSYMIIFFQIFSNSKPNIILIELIFLMLNSIYEITLKHPLHFGGTDLLPHIFYSEVTSLSGHIIPVDLSLYSYFPLYHILISIISKVIHLDIIKSIFLTTAPIYSITIIFLYYLYLKISDNNHVSLLACSLYSISSTVIYFGADMISRSLAFVGFVILLYLIYNDKNHRLIYKLIILLFSVFIILVHQVTAPLMAILISLLYLCEKSVNYKKYVTNNYIVLFCVIFISYWFFIAYLFLEGVFRDHFFKFVSDDTIINPAITTSSYISRIYLVDNLDKSIFLFFCLLAIFYLLVKKWKKEYTVVFGLFSFITLVFYVPNPIHALWQTVGLLGVERFMLLLSPFMMFLMGMGIYIFYTYFSYKKLRGFGITLVILLYCIFVFSSIINCLPDSNYPWQKNSHTYFNEEELKGFERIYSNVPFGSSLYSDYETSRYFIQTKFQDSEKLNLPYYKSNIIRLDKIPSYKGYVIIRDKELLYIGLNFESDHGIFLYDNNKNIQNLYAVMQKNNKVYSNSAISLYINN